MNVKFNTPCFVRVEDAEKRKELIEWLEEIGYKEYGDPFQRYSFGYIYTTIDGEYIPYSVDIVDDSWTDCGTNIDLFKALAAMNDENDYMQWFYVDDNFQLCRYFDRNHDASFRDGMRVLVRKDIRKATAEEIIEYFKDH